MARTNIDFQSATAVSSDGEASVVLSIQNDETDDPHDTPSEHPISEYESSGAEMVMYERVPDPDYGIFQSDTSTGDEGFLAPGVISSILCNSSMEDVDMKKTKWRFCVHCKRRNSNPLYRFCRECFQKRKELFPPRPRGFKKRNEVKEKIKNCKTGSSQNWTKKRPSRSDTEEFESDNENSKRLKLDSTAFDSSDSSEACKKLESKNQASWITKSVTVEEKKINKYNPRSFGVNKELCMMCSTVPIDSIFLHGGIGHLVGCYQCSIKVWKTTKCCPICKVKVRSVVKIYS